MSENRSFFAELKRRNVYKGRNHVCGGRVVVDPSSVDFVSHI